MNPFTLGKNIDLRLGKLTPNAQDDKIDWPRVLHGALINLAFDPKDRGDFDVTQLSVAESIRLIDLMNTAVVWPASRLVGGLKHRPNGDDVIKFNTGTVIDLGCLQKHAETITKFCQNNQ